MSKKNTNYPNIWRRIARIESKCDRIISLLTRNGRESELDRTIGLMHRQARRLKEQAAMEARRIRETLRNPLR